MNLFLRNINPIIVKKWVKLKREKGISHQEFFGISFKRRGNLREIEDYDRGKRRNYKMGSQFFCPD